MFGWIDKGFALLTCPLYVHIYKYHCLRSVAVVTYQVSFCSPSVLYISLHRYEDGTFFPNSEDANYDKVGQGKGRGYNVNIPWSGGKMGDPEYMAAFHHIVMPIAREVKAHYVPVFT